MMVIDEARNHGKVLIGARRGKQEHYGTLQQIFPENRSITELYNRYF
jgi:hypothetical protein